MCNNNCNNSGNQHAGHQEVGAPPLLGPFVKDIPDHDEYKGKQETVDDGVNKDRTGNHTIPEGVLRGDRDKFVQNVFPAPGELLLVQIIQIVFAAVKHAVKVERFLAGEFGDCNVDQQGKQCHHQFEFIRIHKAFVGIYPPDYDRFKRTGQAFHDSGEVVQPAHVDQKRVEISPVLL